MTMTKTTEADIIAAIQAVSRACYGRPGGGVRARDVALYLYDATRDEGAPYDPDTTIVAVQRAIRLLVRRGIASRGQDRYGVFYRVPGHISAQERP